MKLIPLNRRWFRFSLKTLLVAVTVFGLWLGYYVNWMHQRRAARTGAEVFELVDNVVYSERGVIKRVPPPKSYSWCLALLGERFVNAVELRGSGSDPATQEIARRYQKLFPESDIIFHADVPQLTDKEMDALSEEEIAALEAKFKYKPK